MRICPLSSGSSGNSAYVEAGDTRLLIDAGLSCRRLCALLNEIGVRPETLNAICVTHEHIDHVRGIALLSKKYDIPIYANTACHRSMYDRLAALPRSSIRIFESDEPFYIGKVELLPFTIPHDAAHAVGFRISHNRHLLTVMTDVGYIDERIFGLVEGSSCVLLEANHDVDMLMAGCYPPDLKQRILSPLGHLCNEDCARAVVRLAQRGLKTVLLGHLSDENNFPSLALRTVEAALSEAGLADEVVIEVARRDAPTGFFEVA
ncbi:MAG: MBL fold metallo-hydrolase [Clostridia bacterium]|nr:MBL fold metallo-hydrolase [Clostridia bacterium]